MNAVVPELYVTDLARSLRFYVELLGFEPAYGRPESGFAAIALSDCFLMLEEISALTRATDAEFEDGRWRTADLEFPFGRGVSFQVTVADVDAVHARIVDASYPVKLGLRERSYRIGVETDRVRQFLVMDPDGYLVPVAQPIAT